MALIILAFVLIVNAAIKVGLLWNERNVSSAYWYIQPFIFPVFFEISALLEYLNILAVTAYVVLAGLLFELISFLFKRKKRITEINP